MKAVKAGGGAVIGGTVLGHRLPQSWRERAEEFRRFGSPAAAEAFEECARDLEIGAASEGDELLNLRAAAAASGYSEDHLGKLVRSGQIPNAGRPHAPKIRRRHLPRKPTAVGR